MKDTIRGLEGQLRDCINNPWKKHKLIQQKQNFHQLCSALDVIGDSELAVQAFKKLKIINNDGQIYLSFYGLLQALFLQQDSLRHICESLEIQIDLKGYPNLLEIRNVRNSSTGHPSKKNGSKRNPTTYNHIIRHSMSLNGFELLSYSNGSVKYKKISILELLENQESDIKKIIKIIVKNLRSEYQTHKKEYCMKKLIENFPTTLSFAFEKARESLWSDYTQFPGNYGISSIEKSFMGFFNDLEEREPQNLADFEDERELINFSIEKFKIILKKRSEKKDKKTDILDGCVNLSFLRKQSSKMLELAQQIDKEYSKN